MRREGEWRWEPVGLQVLCIQLVLGLAGCATFGESWELRDATGVAGECDIDSGKGLGGDGCDNW